MYFKGISASKRHYISAIRSYIKFLEPTNCSDSDSGTFIQPRLSLNFIVEAHLFLSFTAFLWVTQIVAGAMYK